MKNKPGFSIIEIMVAITIIAILATMIVPNLQQRTAVQERKAFFDKLNALVQAAWRQALVTGRVHRLNVDLQKNQLQLFVASDKKSEKNGDPFVPARSFQVATTLAWPKELVVKNFFIEGFDEIGKFAGRATQEIWFYILPEGVTQSVIMNVVDAREKRTNTGRSFGLVLNPFTGQFKEYDTFQKP